MPWDKCREEKVSSEMSSALFRVRKPLGSTDPPPPTLLSSQPLLARGAGGWWGGRRSMTVSLAISRDHIPWSEPETQKRTSAYLREFLPACQEQGDQLMPVCLGLSQCSTENLIAWVIPQSQANWDGLPS